MGDNRDIRGDVRGEIREFLSTRRARITPEEAGLPVYGGDRRRVPGLRRDEVALLAAISSEYYTRLERGNATGVSTRRACAAGRTLASFRAGSRPHTTAANNEAHPIKSTTFRHCEAFHRIINPPKAPPPALQSTNNPQIPSPHPVHPVHPV